MRVTLIHNPKAGRATKTDAKDLVRTLKDAGHRVTYQSSKDNGWKDVLEEAADLVAVAGGDGTVGKVAKRLAGRGVPLAPIPFGTANNIARSLGVLGLPQEQLIRGWESPRHVQLDVWEARGPW